MADQTCQEELNRQLQVLQSKIEQLEDNIAGLNETVATDIAQTAAGFAALIGEGIVTGLPTYIANQLILKIAATALDMAESELANLEGIGMPGELTAVIDSAEEIVAKILEILSAASLEDLWKKYSYLLMIPQLTIPPYGAAFLNAALSSAQAAIDAAQAALDLDPLNEELQAALQAAINVKDSMENAASAMNNLTACKIANSALGL